MGIDPDVALTRNNLGKLLNEMGRPVEAVPMLAAAVAVLEKRLPAGHPSLALARDNLGKAIRSAADTAGVAEGAFKRTR